MFFLGFMAHSFALLGTDVGAGEDGERVTVTSVEDREEMDIMPMESSSSKKPSTLSFLSNYLFIYLLRVFLPRAWILIV